MACTNFDKTATATAVKKLLILDCDAGVDDAHALLMAVSHPNANLLAITCVQGNVSVDQVCSNVARSVEACRQDRVHFLEPLPIYKGASRSILNLPIINYDFHGKDGLGDSPDEKPVEFKVEEEIAALALVKLARQYPGQISLVATGPLTNLALAARLDPEFSQLLESVVIMGGNIYGKGNTTPSAEFNFHVDPEAAFIVLTDFDCAIYVVSWELTLEHAVNLDWFKSLLDANNKRGQFLKTVTTLSLMNLANIPEIYGVRDWIPCDPVAMAVALDKTVIKASKPYACTVELSGTSTRGQVVVDWNHLSKKPQRVTIITDLDHDRLKQLLWTAVQ